MPRSIFLGGVGNVTIVGRNTEQTDRWKQPLSSDDPSEQHFATTTDASDIPPFTLRMLLIWVAICGVLFEFWRQTGSLPRDLLWQCLIGLQLVVWSAGLSGLGLRIWWWKQERKVPWQPGHWLLCLVGGIGLAAILSKIAELLFWRFDPFPGPTGLWIQENFDQIFLLAVLLAMWGIILFAPMRHIWTLAIFPEAILRLFSFGLGIYYDMAAAIPFRSGSTWEVVLLWSYGIISTICPLPILIIALWDGVMNDQPRDWMHWAGVATWIALLLQPYVMTIFVALAGQ